MTKKSGAGLRSMYTKTLEQLEGVVAPEPSYDSYLVRTLHALRRKPIGEFTTEDLRITIGQGSGIPYLLPLALERLEADPLISGDYYAGDLLMHVLHAEPHWAGMADVKTRVRRIIEQALERLARVKDVDWEVGEDPDPDAIDTVDRARLEPRLRTALARLA